MVTVTWVEVVSGLGHSEFPRFPVIIKSVSVTSDEVRVEYEVDGG